MEDNKKAVGKILDGILQDVITVESVLIEMTEDGDWKLAAVLAAICSSLGVDMTCELEKLGDK